MPFGFGLLQISRTSLLDTTTTISTSPMDEGSCEDTIIFTIDVKVGSDYVESGTVQIINNSDGYVYAEEDIISSGAINIDVTGILDGYAVMYINYIGDNTYKSSQSNPFYYYIEPIMTTASVSINTPTSFAYNDDVELFGEITSTDITPGGTMIFKLYTDNETIIHESEVELSGLNASYIVPGSLLPIGNYYLSVIYSGNGCIFPSFSPLGTAGYQIEATA